MKRLFPFLLALMCLLSSCGWFQHKTADEKNEWAEVGRMDRLEIRFLTTGDRAAWQQMQTEFPQPTRLLVENMLHLGTIGHPEVSSRFFQLFADTVPQAVLQAVDQQYADISDINKHLNLSFRRLQRDFPDMLMPHFYAQIGAFKESVVVNDSLVGISFDKYLGEDFEPYALYFTPEQRKSMTRWYVVPDCISFYLLSLYPLSEADQQDEDIRRLYMARIMWIANKAMRNAFFKNKQVQAVDQFMHNHPNMSAEDLLLQVPLDAIRP